MSALRQPGGCGLQASSRARAAGCPRQLRVMRPPPHQQQPRGTGLCGRRRLVVEAKRSQKKKSARKIVRREEMRSLEESRNARLMAAQEAEAAAAIAAAEAAAPPDSLEHAEQRVGEQQEEVDRVAIQLKTLKTEARESGEYENSMGFRTFPEVQEALVCLGQAKTTLAERRLEAALWKLAEITGRKRHLADFNWTFGSPLTDNTECLGYMLGNCQKFQAVEAAQDILAVADEQGVAESVDIKMLAWLQEEQAAQLSSAS